MNRSTIASLIILMSVSVIAFAQKKSEVTKWKIAGEIPAAAGQKKTLGLAGPVTGVHNGVLIVAGGSNFPNGMPWLGGKKKYYNEMYVFKKNNNGSLLPLKLFRLPFALAYSANVSTSNGVVVAGGENENGISNKVLLLQWNEASQNVIIKDLPDLPFVVTNAATVVHDEKIYLAGGEMMDQVSSHFLFLDLNDLKAGWKNLPSLSKPVSHFVMVVQSNGKDQCIYLIGGRKKNASGISDLYSFTFQFDLNTNKWTEKKFLPHALSAGTGVAVGSNSILLFGGDNGATFHKTEELIVAISLEKSEVKKKELDAQKIKLQSTHPGFCRQMLLYDVKKNQWKPLGNIPYDSPVTTTAVKWNDEVFIPGGEIRAGVRTPQILSFHLSP